MFFKILDVYLFKKVVGTFIGLVFLTYFIFGLIDVVANGLTSLSNMNEVGRFFSYYFLYYYRFVGSFFSFLIFLAAVVVLYTIDSNHELIALKTMGISPARIIAPLLVGAIVISLLLTAFREIYVPSQVNYLSLSRDNYIKRSDEMEVNRSIDDECEFTFDGEKIVLSEGRLIKPRIVVGARFNRYGSRFVADSATYMKDDSSERPEGWLLDGLVTPKEFLNNSSLVNPETNRTVFYSPADTPWLEEGQVFVATRLTPTNLVAGDYWFTYGKLSDLRGAIKDPTFKNKIVELVVNVHTRIGRVFTDLIPFFLGVPLYMNMSMGKKTIGKLFKSSYLPIAYVIVQSVCQVVGGAAGVPDVAVCGPWVFLLIAATLYLSLFRKEV